MASPVPNGPRSTLPFVMGPYEAVAELGSGGMASVYLARRRGAGRYERLVALKVMHSHLGTEEAARFEEEARITASIHHPNVCSAIDFGRQDGIAYFAMEWLSGRSVGAVLEALRDRGDDGLPMSQQALVGTLLAAACDGLHAAHEQTDATGSPLHIVHRDISPSNLFVTFDGQVKIIDFGIARDSASSRYTEPGHVAGKLPYMSPEQLRGEAIDRRADIWSLGVVLWEGLAGRRLFSADSIASLTTCVLTEPIAPPSRFDASIRPALDRTVLRALQRDRASRWRTALEVAVELRAALRDHGESMLVSDVADAMSALFPGGREAARTLSVPHAPREGRAAPRPAQPTAPARRELTAAALLVTTATVVSIALASSWNQPSPPPDVASPETASPETASPETTSPETASPETASPETASPETASPETASPETASPEIASPETASPETASPEIASPETASPETASPEIASAESSDEPPGTGVAPAVRAVTRSRRGPVAPAGPSPTAPVEPETGAAPDRGAVRVIMQGACHATYRAAAALERSQTAGRVLNDVPAGRQRVLVRVGTVELERDVSVTANETTLLTVPCP